jgi:hypothetical protein
VDFELPFFPGKWRLYIFHKKQGGTVIHSHLGLEIFKEAMSWPGPYSKMEIERMNKLVWRNPK